MIALTCQEIANATQGTLLNGASTSASPVMTSVSIDSRTIATGALFVAIQGERFDGHDFLRQAKQAGAVAAMVSQTFVAAHADLVEELSIPLIVVQDTANALCDLAGWYRRERLRPATRVVGVTGSNGKTTTKFLLAHLLEGAMQVLCSKKSFNNHIGVPLTILSADDSTEVLVLELGTSSPGEISFLSEIAKPDIGLITSIGLAHVEKLGNLEGVAQEKTALVRSLPANGLAVVNVDQDVIRPWLSSLSCRVLTFGLTNDANTVATIHRITPEGTYFSLRDHALHQTEALEHMVPLAGQHHASNAAGAILVARALGVEDGHIVRQLASFTPATGRCQIIQLPGVTLIDDTYNANPASMMAAMETLSQLQAAQRVFVMGDMFELGEDSASLHRAVAQHAVDCGIDLLVLAGPVSNGLQDELKRYAMQRNRRTHIVGCPNIQAVTMPLLNMIRHGAIVWFKASRAMALETVVEAVRSALSHRGAAKSDMPSCSSGCR